jgi:hypothetical protein
LRRERPSTLKRLGCASHARRRFYKAAEESGREALGFIAQIRQLYLLEEETQDLDSDERKAVNCFLNEYTALVGSRRDGKFPIDNNLVENEVRPSVVGRKRWWFIGHPDAGWPSAVIYTIIQSCRRRGLNPQDYLTDVLRRLPSMKNHPVKEWLPSRWKPQSE